MSTIRTFRAATFREALEQVREELGDEALILGQREVRRRRFPWFRHTVEAELTVATGPETDRVVAARRSLRSLLKRDAGEPPALPGPRQSDLFPVGDAPPTAEPVHATASGPRFDALSPLASGTLASGPAAAASDDDGALDTPAAALVHADRHAHWDAVTSCDPFRVYTHLIEQDVDESDAREIVSGLQRFTSTGGAPSRAQDWLLAQLRQMVPCRGPIRVEPGRTRVVAAVGPTGVGKTTTIAKLAANFRLREQLRVGLITMDTYRVAAIDQLQTYAQLIDIPLRVVTAPREMPSALDSLAGLDLVLIDTAGRSPHDELRIQELRAFLQAAQADEVHLVLSLTSAPRSLAAAAEKFQRLGPTSVLLTKLDEAAGAGTVLSAARRARLPLSYITTGQDVPDDIEIPTADRLAQEVLSPVTGLRFGTAGLPAGANVYPDGPPPRTASRRTYHNDCRNPIKTDNLDSRS